MNAKSVLPLLLLLVSTTQITFANEPLENLARKAAAENTAESVPAIEELRSLGPAGFQTLMRQYAHQIEDHISHPNIAPSAEWARITAALDSVSQQKNSYLSGLYWYTDLKEAQKASVQSGKPILSLRLLGKLTDELSCANSRFFRTALYPDNEVGSILRDRFVLHWESVRPVPVITIDFGDGRKLERTVTGNSIHYVLDSSGRPIDAMPGLYGPRAFARSLLQAENLYKSLGDKTEVLRRVALNTYYRDRVNKISLDWLADNTKIGGKPPAGVLVDKDNNGQAIMIMPLAVTKAFSETTVLRAMTAGTEALGQITDEAAWKKLALLHQNDAVLDERSISLIEKQNQGLRAKQMNKLIQRFQDAIALDTIRNEYVLRPKLYSWMSLDRSRDDLSKLNERVYAELFLTPSSDPWLGLLTPEIYTAIDNGGIVKR